MPSTGCDDNGCCASPKTHGVDCKVPPIVDTSALKIVVAETCIISVVAKIGRTAECAPLPNLVQAFVDLNDPLTRVS